MSVISSEPSKSPITLRSQYAPFLAWWLILLSPLPLLLVHFRRLWLYDHYRYFPFVIGAFAYFVWQRWPSHSSAREKMTRPEFGLLTTGAFILSVATFVWSPWLAAVSALFLIIAALSHFAGSPSLRKLLPAWLLLFFLIPLPLNWDVQLTFKLQTIASQAASYLLDLFDIRHLLSGHILEIPRRQFLVEEACSGIQSLFALFAFAGIMMLFLGRSLLHSLLVLAAAGFWAVSMNVIRVTAVVATFTWFRVDLSTAWKHELLGLALYGFALLMLVCTDRLVLFLLERPDEEYLVDEYFREGAEGESDVDEDFDATDTPRSRAAIVSGAAIGFTVIFTLLGAVQGVVLVMKADARRVVGQASARLDGAFSENTLPERLGAWRRVGFESQTRPLTSIQGPQFAVWTYERDGATASIYVDYPFYTWHHLPNCYVARGLKIESLDMLDAPASTPATEVWRIVVGQPTGRLHVRFSEFDSAGRPVRPTDRLLGSWKSGLTRSVSAPLPFLRLDQSIYQVVMQASPKVGTTELDADELTADFMQAQQIILQTILDRLHRDD